MTAVCSPRRISPANSKADDRPLPANGSANRGLRCIRAEHDDLPLSIGSENKLLENISSQGKVSGDVRSQNKLTRGICAQHAIARERIPHREAGSRICHPQANANNGSLLANGDAPWLADCRAPLLPNGGAPLLPNGVSALWSDCRALLTNGGTPLLADRRFSPGLADGRASGRIGCADPRSNDRALPPNRGITFLLSAGRSSPRRGSSSATRALSQAKRRSPPP